MKAKLATRLTWIFLILSSLTLAFFAIFSLYREHSIRQERRAEVLLDHSENLNQQLTAYLDEIKLQSARQLIGFHEEGLTQSLERWNDSNALIHHTLVRPSDPEFPQNLDTSPVETIDLDAPDTPSSLRSGFYFDNKEIALFENGGSQPILVWEFDQDNTDQSWTLSHRIAPSRQIRMANLSNVELASAFNRFIEQTKSPSFNSKVVAHGPETNGSPETLSTLIQLPGYMLITTIEGDAPTPWYSVYGVLLISLCLILGTLCIVLIFKQTQKEREEALLKTNFVSQISHEFKTPLTSISLYADLLAEDSNPKLDRPKLLETISRESHRLSDLVDNILALNALESGKKQYRPRTFDAVDAVKASIEDYSASFAQKKLELEWAGHDQPIHVHFDPANLRQILLNILDNSRKYASEGKKVNVSIQKMGTFCIITITDYGPGIPEDNAEKIFDSFYQISSTLTKKSPGAGIGLSLSRRLARDCGGDLALDKSYRDGARFIIQLPLSPSSTKQA